MKKWILNFVIFGIYLISLVPAPSWSSVMQSEVLSSHRLSKEEALAIATKIQPFLGTWITVQYFNGIWYVSAFSKSANPPVSYIIRDSDGKVLYQSQNADASKTPKEFITDVFDETYSVSEQQDGKFIFTPTQFNIPLKDFAQHLTSKKLIYDNFWKILGYESTDPKNRQRTFHPTDHRLSEITVMMDRNGSDNVESVQLTFKDKYQKTVKDLEKIMGSSKTAIIGPSDPGYRNVIFPDVEMKSEPYSVSVIGRVENYTIVPDSVVTAVTFIRNKK